MGLSKTSGNTELWASNCEQTMCLMTKAKSILDYIRRIIFFRSLEAILPIHSAQECLTQVWVMKKRSQTLLMNTHWQDRRRWTQIKIYEIEYMKFIFHEYMKKNTFTVGVVKLWDKLLREVIEFPPWDIFKTWLDIDLSNLL